MLFRSSKAGQFGEMLKKAPDLFKAAEGLDVTMGQSAAKDIAEHGIGVGPLRIPGTKGIGSLFMNQTPAYSMYQAALDPLVLANAHALSGARINQDQANMIKRSIERQAGDYANKGVVAQRDKNVIDQLNSIAASLPRDAVIEQENQMPEEVLADLVARGYKRVGTGAGNAAASPAAPSVDALRAALRAKGHSDSDIRAALKARGLIP